MRHALLMTSLVAALGGLAACADDLNQMLIVHNVAPDQMCEFHPENDYIPHGTLEIVDLGFADHESHYELHPLFRSLMSKSAAGTDKVAIVTGANVQLLPVNSDDSRAVIDALRSAGLDKQQQRFSSPVEPESDTVSAMEAITGQQAVAMRALVAPGEAVEIIARVQAFGDVDGTHFESQLFDYPITVCNECQLRSVGLCSDFDAGEQVGSNGLCGELFTDGIISCCDDGTGSNFCPGVGTGTM